MLHIENLHAGIDEQEILKGINLHIKAGEVHAIMGPNGSGKSTLASVLTGRPDYTVTKGKVEFLGKRFTQPFSRRKSWRRLVFKLSIPGRNSRLKHHQFYKNCSK